MIPPYVSLPDRLKVKFLPDAIAIAPEPVAVDPVIVIFPEVVLVVVNP